jgi:hypothetical protein
MTESERNALDEVNERSIFIVGFTHCQSGTNGIWQKAPLFLGNNKSR